MLKSISETSKMLGIGRTLIYRLISEGALEIVKIGNRTLVTIDSIERLIESKRVTAKHVP